MNISENQSGQTKQILGQASPQVFASLNSDKVSDKFRFLSKGGMSERGMVSWNLSQPFEANYVVPKYLQDIAGISK